MTANGGQHGFAGRIQFTHLAQLVSCTLEFVLHRQFEKLRDALKVGIAR